MTLQIKPKQQCRWDLVSLGEVMLRFDPGDRRIWTTRSFEVSEGGGEYNVARGLKRCFGLDTAVVTAIVDNPVGRLLEDLLYQGGVDPSLIRWVADDGVGRSRAQWPQLYRAGIWRARRARLFRSRPHCGVSAQEPAISTGTKSSASSEPAGFTPAESSAPSPKPRPDVALEAMTAARKHGTIISYDLNYRESLWKAIGGKKRAQEINRRLAPLSMSCSATKKTFPPPSVLRCPASTSIVSNVEKDGFKNMIANRREGVPFPGGGHHPAQSQDRHAERLGRHLL